MTPLPSQLTHAPTHTSNEVVVWRLERPDYVATWEQGIGASQLGGRWNPRGVPAIYTSFDPATTILELAAHVQFHRLDNQKRMVLGIEILDPTAIFVVEREDLPNSNWLVPGSPSRGQQEYGASLLSKHPMFAVPSLVSPMSWNLVLNPAYAKDKFRLRSTAPFVLDGRLSPPT